MPQRRGLLIGIDAYDKVPRLNGCVNDTMLVRSLLVDQFGFPEAALTTLTNEAATRTAILAALDALVDATGADDIVVIQYAGHGSQMWDREGTKPNKLDNTIMPVDSGRDPHPNLDITDDEIHERLASLAEKTRNTTLLVDACHSATITRDAFGDRARFVPADRRPPSQLPPSPLGAGARAVSRDVAPSGWLPRGDSYVLLAGCRDEEVSYEYRPPEHDRKISHGALTWFLSRELRAATASTSWRDVFERAAANVTANNAAQHPQIEGQLDRALFGVTDLAPMRFVRVAGRTGAAVTIAAGAALGMTVGSRFSVHPQGTKAADAGNMIGEVEVTAVRATTADARILHESADGVITAGARAVETEHDFGELRLAVRIVDGAANPQAVAALAADASTSPLLRVTDGDDAMLCVYLLPARTSGDAGPVPQLGALAAPTWAAVAADGQLIGPPKPADDRAGIVTQLATLAKYRQALALDNPDPASPLRGTVSLELLRWQPDGTWTVAQPDEGGQVVYVEGDPIAWRITNRHSQALHVNVLDFGIRLGIDLLYPVVGATDKVDPGVTFNIGATPGQPPEYRLEFPDGWPWDGDRRRDGTEVFKAILTTHPADFSFLQQGGVRGVASPALQLLQRATGATREAKRYPVTVEDWTTVTRTVTLRRRT